MSDLDERFAAWLADLEARHLADLTFPEVSRALRALSSAYVERRARLRHGAALDGAGKRAAFALFYGPLHFLLIAHIIRQLPQAATIRGPLLDLGCGTGAAGAAWASACASPPEIVGVDRHPWALAEALRTYELFGLRARTRSDNFVRAPLPPRSAVLLAFAVNELDDPARAILLDRLERHASSGGRLLIVEPLAGGIAPWWNEWRTVFERLGGRADEWRLRTALPPIVAKLDRAAGLRHQEIMGRSIFV